MAGDWIKVRHDLPTDPAVIAIAGALGITEDEVVGKLIRFWIWGDQQTKNGCAVGVTKTFLDRHLCAPNFTEAMENVGWLDVTDEGISIPKFERHISQSAKTRALAARRMAKVRGKKPLRKRCAASATPSSLLFSSLSCLSSSLLLPEKMVFEEIKEPLEAWVDYKQKRGEPYKDWPKQLSLLLKQHGTAEQFKAAVEHSMANNYAGCYAPKGGSGERARTGSSGGDPTRGSYRGPGEYEPLG